MSLGERIYQYRKAKGMSQDALAELLDVSRQSVSKWENDTAQPELSKLTIMCDLFGVSLDELARGKQPQPAAQPESQESQGSQESQASPESETSLHAAKRTKSLQRTLGIGLLLLSAFQMTLLLVLRFQADEILILLLPLLLCGIICLVCKKHTFLWIGWIISLFLALSPYYFFGSMSITFHGSLSSSGPSSLSATSFGRALPRNAAESDIKKTMQNKRSTHFSDDFNSVFTHFSDFFICFSHIFLLL